MKLPLATILIALTLLSACHEKNTPMVSDKEYVQLTIQVDNPIPSIDMKDFILITNNAEAEKADAKQIMQVKQKMPLACKQRIAHCLMKLSPANLQHGMRRPFTKLNRNL